MAEDGSSTPMDLDGKTAMSLDSESDEGETVEMLVSGRSKRSTAGNRMSSMIGEIAADDDLELLFAEDEEGGPDEEFEEDVDDAASDNDLGDSSDDDDQGPAAGVDDLDGEKEIERQAKEERKRKRKAQREFTKPSKKIKRAPFMEAAGPSVPASKVKKKVERLSWVPTPGDSVRTSKRETTTQQSEALRTRIVAREKERKEQVKRLEEKARRREANKPRKLTQEDRLKEAAEVEKENSKSLNRWEAIERERQEEQKARLAALQNRQLQGPVVTYWTGPARWIGDKLTAVGSEKVKRAHERGDLKEDDVGPEKEQVSEKDAGNGSQVNTQSPTRETAEKIDSKPSEEGEKLSPELTDQTQQGSSMDVSMRPKSSGSAAASIQVTAPTGAPSASPQPSVQDQSRLGDRSDAPSDAPSVSPQRSPQPSTQAPVPSEAPSASPQPAAQSQELDTANASPQPPNKQQPEDQQDKSSTPVPVSSNEQPGESDIKEEPLAVSSTSKNTPSYQPGGAQQIVFSLAPPQASSTTPSTPSAPATGSQLQVFPLGTTKPIQQQPSQQSQVPPGPPPPPPKPVTATRNLISIVNVDVSNPSSPLIPKELRGSLLLANSRPTKRGRIPKPPPPPTCSVTGLSVKYRDSKTGLGYANPYAYRQLKNVRDGKLGWNEITGTYTGPTARVADGVPEEFLKIMKAEKA